MGEAGAGRGGAVAVRRGRTNLKRSSISRYRFALLLVLASWAGSVALIRSSFLCGPVPGLKG
jgi:hypothetical protein